MKKKNTTKPLCVRWVVILVKRISQQVRNYFFLKKVEKNKRELLALGDHLLCDIGFKMPGSCKKSTQGTQKSQKIEVRNISTIKP